MSFENQELNSNMDLLDLDTLFNEDLPMLLSQFPGLWEADVGGKAVSSAGTADQADPASSISHKGEDDLTQDSEAETSQDLDELFYEDDERKSMGNEAEVGEAVSAQEVPATAAANTDTVNPATGVPGTQSMPSAPGTIDPRKTVYTGLLHPAQPGPAQLPQWIRLPTGPSTMNGAGTASTGTLPHQSEPAPNAPAGDPISLPSSTPAPNAAAAAPGVGPTAAELQNQPASSKRSARKGTAKPSLGAQINESNRVTKQAAASQRVPCALPRLQLPAVLPSLGSAETAGSAHVAGPSAPIASTAARREPSPFLRSHPSPGPPAPVTEQSAAPSPSTRSAKKGPAAKTPRPRARADESSKVTKKPTRAPPKRPATPPSLVTNTPSVPSSTITTPHSLGEIVPPGPPTPKKKSFKGRGPCKGRDWSIRPEPQGANGPGMGQLAAEQPAPQARWMAAEMQMRASHGPDLLMASGSQGPAPPQQQLQQPAPQAYLSVPAGMHMGATAHAQGLPINWAPLPEEAQQPQLLAAPDDGYAWAGIGHDVPAPVQEPLSDYDATIARQLASQMAWFPQDASEEFDASYEVAPEESRLFMRPKL
ncbi:hypothetical protein BDZ91DRAFT_820940 [Kalaharituber pfeilii]|nr:hypothetical protein BDZ91DRAFT_820940 [Kalaharituber pfeilii]